MSKVIDFVQNLKFRKWLYGVLLAVLVLLGSEGIISATQQDNIGAIIASVLQTVPAAGFALAIRKVTPAATDTADVDLSTLDTMPISEDFNPADLTQVVAPTAPTAAPTDPAVFGQSIVL